MVSSWEDLLRALFISPCSRLDDSSKAAPEARAGLSNRRLEGMSPEPSPQSFSASLVSRQHGNEWARGLEPDCLCLFEVHVHYFMVADLGGVTYLPNSLSSTLKFDATWLQQILVISTLILPKIPFDAGRHGLPHSCRHGHLSWMLRLSFWTCLHRQALIFLNLQGLKLLDWLLYKIAEVDWLIW